MTIPLRLLEAYLKTIYTFTLEKKQLSLRVGKTNNALNTYLISQGFNTAIFITAYNPESVATSDKENLAANERLYKSLKDHASIIFDGYGQGEDGHWPPEESFLAVGLDKETGLSLAKLYKQNAFIYYDSKLGAQLILNE